jgi:ABC-type lipoprotein release transport system permease subunit
VRVATVEVDGVPAQIRGVGSERGPVPSAVDEGHAAGPGEIVVGRASAQDFGLDLGDEVHVTGDVGEVDLEVVGIGPMAGIVDAPVVGQGAIATLADVERIARLGDEGGETDGFDTYLVGLEPGADVESVVDAVGEAAGEPPILATTPDEFERFDQVRWLPVVLVSFLGAIAVLATVQSLLAAVRRRRHELGVLRALGFRSPDVGVAVATQAVVVTLLGAIVGVPLGLALGRWLWFGLAGQLGVIRVVDVPWVWVALAVVVALVVDLAISWWPTRRATRVSAAETLRAE